MSRLPEKTFGRLEGKYNEGIGLTVDFGDGEFIKVPSKQEIEGGYRDNGELIYKIKSLSDDKLLRSFYVPTFQKDETGTKFLWVEVKIMGSTIKPSSGLTFPAQLF